MQIGDLYFEEGVDSILVGLFVITVLAFIAAVLRLYVRLLLVKAPGLEDALIAAAIVASTAYLASSLHLVGYAPNVANDPSMWPKLHQSLYSTIIAYTITHFSFKLSIVFQSKRIFVSPTAQRTFLVLIIYLGIWSTLCLFLSIATCVPVHKYWDDTVPGRCIDRMALHYAIAGVNIVNDVAIVVAPLLFVKSLQMSRRTKFGLMALFACGGIACIFAMVRVHALYDKGIAPAKDQPYKAAITALWSGLEINIAIICACVPALRALPGRFIGQRSTLDSAKSKSSRRYAKESLQWHPVGDQAGTEPGRWATDNTATGVGGLEIEVQQSFEMKTVDAGGADDSSSQRDLVAKGCKSPHWKTHIYSSSTGKSGFRENQS